MSESVLCEEDSVQSSSIDVLTQEVLAVIKDQSGEIKNQTENAKLVDTCSCTEEQRINCAMQYGTQAVDNKILISISTTINDMAKEINKSEEQKSEARTTHMQFFKRILVALLVFVAVLIILNAISNIAFSVSKEVFISIIAVIISDVIAIIHSFVKYMNSVEHYKVYNNLIDSLLKHLNHGKPSENFGAKDM